MALGGKRPGAGQPKLTDRDTTRKAVSGISEKIDNALPRAFQALVNALNATKMVAKINGRDEEGRPTYEYHDVPDHYIRTRAAKMIIDKRIPDVAKHVVETTNDQPFAIVVNPYKPPPNTNLPQTIEATAVEIDTSKDPDE